ncbi:hypothetical protein DSO57_1016826 [Entomophthora muscae]|uniref:Uncharacterized protein n=1 Tax=Entomophthora muscae TaxID=34485 RepID=A0ACC2UDK7_9FUNG|nr:hypothetical protein DSO57_1016826 [Entomophthora muscae]
MMQISRLVSYMLNDNLLIKSIKSTTSCVNKLYTQAKSNHPGMACAVVDKFSISTRGKFLWYVSEEKCGILTSRTVICAPPSHHGWIYFYGIDSPSC